MPPRNPTIAMPIVLGRLGALAAAIGIVVLLAIFGQSASGISAQYEPVWRCRVFATFENGDRRVDGAPNTECSWPHTVPFGNWGVTSNVGPRYDGDQFNGWYMPGDGWWEWNSCRSSFPPPNCAYYNEPWCYAQVSPTPWVNNPPVVNEYAQVMIGDFEVSPPADDSGGCLDLHGMPVGSSGNFTSVYELDPWDQDDFVQRLNYDILYTVMACEDPYYCYGESPWNTVLSREPTSNDYEVNALIRIRLWTDLSFY